jgi:hypothetical protein
MVAADDIAVKAKSDHQQEPAIPDQSDVDTHRSFARNGGGQRFRVTSQAEMLRHQVFCACRQDRQGHARLFVEQGGHGAVTADGNEAPTPRVARRLADERRSFKGCERELLDEASPTQRAH